MWPNKSAQTTRLPPRVWPPTFGREEMNRARHITALRATAGLVIMALCGCDSERSQLKMSPWYRDQKNWVVSDTNTFFLSNTREIWLGSIANVDTNGGTSVRGPITVVVLHPAIQMAGRKNKPSYVDGVHIDWPTNSPLPDQGDRWAVSCERDIKGQRYAVSHLHVSGLHDQIAEPTAGTSGLPAAQP